MVAETLTATRAARTFPVTKSRTAGVVNVAWGTYAVAVAALEDGDIFEMCVLPAGCTVIGGWLQCQDLDTGIETVDFMVGWAANADEVADPNGLLLAGVKTGDISVHLDVASTWMPLAGVLLTAGPKTFTAETVIQVEVNVAQATPAAGQLTLVVLYTTA
jgi:hypothetical protein